MAEGSRIKISTSDARMHLYELLRRVEGGESFTITVRGRAVADIVPSDSERRRTAEAVDRLMNAPRVAGVDGDTILEWIREGRK